MPLGGRLFLWLASIFFSSMPVLFSVAPNINDIYKLSQPNNFAASANEILFLCIIVSSIAFVDCVESAAHYFSNSQPRIGAFVSVMSIVNTALMIILGIYYGQLFQSNEVANLGYTISIFVIVLFECFVCRVAFILAA